MELILGRTGSGKSVKIADRVERLLENSGNVNGNGLKDKIIIIVPDQYTVKTEKYYMERFGESKMTHIAIMSLKQLCRITFSEYGIPVPAVIGNGGKNVLTARALDDVKMQLKYFRADNVRISFYRTLARSVTLLKSAGISPEDLESAAEDAGNDKLKDIALVYAAYDAILANGIFDPTDNLNVLSEYAVSKRIFENTNIFFDNFKTFSWQELRTVCALTEGGANVTAALPADGLVASEYSLLDNISKQAVRIKNDAERHGVKVHTEILSSNKRALSADLTFLESHLFAESDEKYEEELTGIELYEASDRSDEVDFVASKITEMLRGSDGRYKASDFVITARDMNSYAAVLDPVFARYGLPLFYHKKTPLRQKKPVALIDALFSSVVYGYERETVLALMKTGLTKLSVEEISRFQNYTEKWNIEYKGFLKPFEKSCVVFGKPQNEEDKANVEKTEATRKYVIDIFESFAHDLRGEHTAREISEAVCKVFEKLDTANAIIRIGEEYRHFGEDELYKEECRTYETVIAALDEIVLASGEEKISAQRYRELLLSIIDEADIGIIPTSDDRIVAGGAETIPFSSPKFVFVLGLNDGVFPPAYSDADMIDDDDKETIYTSLSKDIGQTAKDSMMYERYLVYNALAAPSSKLFMSYDGSKPKSYVIDELTGLFPKLEIKKFTGSNDDIVGRLQSEASSFELYAKTKNPSLKKYFETANPYADFIRNGESEPGNERIGKEIAKKMFSDEINLSATKVTTFRECGFKYFCKYGMKIDIQRIAEFDALNTGNFVHAALDTIMSEGLPDDDDELRLKVDEFADEYFKEIDDGRARTKKYFERLKDKLFRLFKIFRDDLKDSKFKPIAYELPITKGKDCIAPVEIEYSGGKVRLTGKVDRVDMYNGEDGKKYIRVIDYKTGRKDFDLRHIFYGIDVQMLMYLYALSCSDNATYKGSIPAGVLYVNADAKIVEMDKPKKSERNADEILDKERKRTGIVLNNEEILNAYGKKYLPMVRTKPNTATSDQFNLLFSHISGILAEIGEALYEGKIGKNPLHKKNDISDNELCKFCPMEKYCDSDRARQCTLNEMDTSLSKESIYSEMEKEAQEKNG